MNAPTVFVVDDDAGVLTALSRLLRTVGYDVQTFKSPQEFLETHDPALPSCVVLDVAMPGIDGLTLQSLLNSGGTPRPVIFVTGKGDIPTSVRAMKSGAVDFLTKPVKDEDLLAAIERALHQELQTRRAQADLNDARAKLACLTPREREVLSHVVAGRLNKQIAGDLGTAEKTVKVHRGRMMQKLGVRTVADLVRFAERVGITPSHPDNELIT
jgi:FixJ family two-component response regulator